MSEKIGKSVLNFNPPKTKLNPSFTQGFKYKEEAKERILAVLRNSERPLNVSELQRLTGIETWVSTKQVLVDLEAEGRVEHFRSGRYLLFKLKRSE